MKTYKIRLNMNGPMTVVKADTFEISEDKLFIVFYNNPKGSKVSSGVREPVSMISLTNFVEMSIE